MEIRNTNPFVYNKKNLVPFSSNNKNNKEPRIYLSEGAEAFSLTGSVCGVTEICNRTPKEIAKIKETNLTNKLFKKLMEFSSNAYLRSMAIATTAALSTMFILSRKEAEK